MGQRLLERLVTVLILHILAHDGDGDFVPGVVATLDQIFPLAQIAFRRFPVQIFQNERVQAFEGETERHFVDERHGLGSHHGALLDVAEGGNLLLDLAAQGAFRAAEQNIGLDADAQQLLDRVLRGLGLQLLGGGNPRHQREVDKDRVLAAQFLTHLADGLEKRQRFDVAHRAADLDNGHVGAVGGHLADGVFDLVGHVGNHLNGLTQVVAASFLQNDLLVDAAGGQVVVARQDRVSEALIMAQIEVRLGPIVGDKDLAVLERRHGARIDVEVGVELHHIHAQAAAFKQAADGRSRQTLP